MTLKFVKAGGDEIFHQGQRLRRLIDYTLRQPLRNDKTAASRGRLRFRPRAC